MAEKLIMQPGCGLPSHKGGGFRVLDRVLHLVHHFDGICHALWSYFPTRQPLGNPMPIRRLLPEPPRHIRPT